MTKIEKAKLSRAIGRSFVVFDQNGDEVETIRGRYLVDVIELCKKHNGEAWISGRCTVPNRPEWNKK